MLAETEFRDALLGGIRYAGGDCTARLRQARSSMIVAVRVALAVDGDLQDQDEAAIDGELWRVLAAEVAPFVLTRLRCARTGHGQLDFPASAHTCSAVRATSISRT